MKWLEDVSLSNRHNNGQDSYKACEKKEDSERPDWAWPCPRLRDRNKQSNKDKHRPACKAAPQRLFSCSTGPISSPTQRSSAEWRSWLHLAPFKLSHEIKKNASEISFRSEATRALSCNREDDPLHRAAVPKQNNWDLGGEVAAAFCITGMLKALQWWERVFSLKEIALPLLIPTQKR